MADDDRKRDIGYERDYISPLSGVFAQRAVSAASFYSAQAASQDKARQYLRRSHFAGPLLHPLLKQSQRGERCRRFF